MFVTSLKRGGAESAEEMFVWNSAFLSLRWGQATSKNLSGLHSILAPFSCSAATQDCNERSDIRERDRAVLVDVCLFEKRASLQNCNKRSDIQKRHFTVKVAIA